MKLLTVLVTGGRDFSDRKRVFDKLNAIHHAKKNGRRTQRIVLIVHGGARGADAIAGLWAAKAGVICKVYPADWGKWDRAAGPIRNEQMLREEDVNLVVAFPGNNGTAHMVNIALAAGIEIHKVVA